MKKILLAALVSLPVTAFAAANNVGSCGLGSKVFEGQNGIAPQVLAVTTNGTPWPVLRRGLDLFHDIGVSLDFAEAERHDAFRGRPGTFAAAVNTLRALTAAGVETEMVTCLTRLNCPPRELTRLLALAQSLQVGHWRLNRFRANGRGLANQDQLALTPALLPLPTCSPRFRRPRLPTTGRATTSRP